MCTGKLNREIFLLVLVLESIENSRQFILFNIDLWERKKDKFLINRKNKNG